MPQERFPLTDEEMEEFLENIKDEDIPPLPEKYKTIDWLKTEENLK